MIIELRSKFASVFALCEDPREGERVAARSYIVAVASQELFLRESVLVFTAEFLFLHYRAPCEICFGACSLGRSLKESEQSYGK